MSVLAETPPTPPSYKMTGSSMEPESYSNKRKAQDQDQESSTIPNPTIQQLQNNQLPDTPTSTVSNRVSSSNGKDKTDAESPTSNKKSKNNPILETDRHNKIKLTSSQSLARGLAYSTAMVSIQQFIMNHEGIIEEFGEDHYPFFALAVQGNELESKDIAKQIYEKICDDSEVDVESQESQPELKPSEKVTIEVIIKAIEKVASRANWGLEWEDVDDSVEKGEKIPTNHKLSRFQLWTWEVNDPSTLLAPKIAAQVSSRTSLRSTSRSQAIQLFNNLSEQEKSSYLKNKPVPKGASSGSKNDSNKEIPEEVEKKKGGEIKESSIPNTPTSSARKEKEVEDLKAKTNEKTPAPSQIPKNSKRKSSGSNVKEAISIDSSDTEMEKDADGDISMKSNQSSSSKEGKASRSSSPSKKEKDPSPTKGKGKKKELTEEEKTAKEKREEEKKRKEAAREEKKAKEEKKEQARKSQSSFLAGFLGKSNKSKASPGGDSSKTKASSSSTTPSSSGSKQQAASTSNNASGSTSETDFERTFQIIPPNSRQTIAELNRFAKGKQVAPLDELFEQDISTSELFSQFKSQNPIKPSSRHISRHQTRPRVVIRDVMSLVAESDAVGGKAAIEAAKGLRDLKNPKKVWKKHIEFVNSQRPAWYGTRTQPSNTVGPCTPFHKDVALDYSYESDDAWEEEPEDADELNGQDDDDSDSDADSEDSWLVDDDMDLDEEVQVVPLPDDDDDIVAVNAQGVALSSIKQTPVHQVQAKKKKKPKQPSKLVPFSTGPHWEIRPGLPSYEAFGNFQAQLLGDAFYGLNPFEFVSKIKIGQNQVVEEEDEEEASDGISSFNSKSKPSTKKAATVFPEAKMKELLSAINQKPMSKAEMVKTILPLFKDYTTKAAFERVVSESIEKSGKVWVVKSELLTRYNLVNNDSNFFSGSPKKQPAPQ